MVSAIIILVLLGLMDLMLFVACFELEKEREIEEERWKNEQNNRHSENDENVVERGR